ncbi:hypothetical protein BGL34_06700 [Fructilactobacillus lindneri]|uniref:DUF2252 domain-containing protein n=1 Tax=Fructilactobacillus lindneri DSM 20690 = JCM 11027 TaxID=1122148 RepID=A0A0R2K0C0_9LACO|nr:DUF2252 domain-containing protein [Fructilactobacillus lindneri]KRN79677.1 hypothetical protein IV52_GL000214 [Fructilactobacillus lindneri DSM 20690 = JCM 11027]POH04649.1 hypothetical protein BGL34_06700 [Fructilactobacillus lindneri]POH07159.1 hypothetical protein BGL35_07155 [Fructilactobacillus lindneri]POH24424.1 hypothetical protein BHU33_07190 [Fructilactobacillus lindneri DSM 20690 = JCM 11027]SKA07326.1 Uncharacterized conserved protein, DUF2252 family [Fructilactobacillus lindner
MSKREIVPYQFNQTDILTKTSVELMDEGKRLGIDAEFDEIADFKSHKRDIKKIMDVRNSLLYHKLLKLKRKRMSKSAFAFYRGTVDIMNHDLEQHYTSGIKTLIGGDAHLGNFGYYGSPEGKLLFDMNDFDESHVAHWEYDVKRLLVSALLVAKQQGFDIAKDVNPYLEKVMNTYLNALIHLRDMPSMKRFIMPNTLENIASTFDAIHDDRDHFDQSYMKLVNKTVEKAIRSNSDYAVKKYTEVVDGKRRFIEDAPVTKHVGNKTYQRLTKGYYNYRSYTRSDVHQFLAQFHIVDIVRHSVGVGSVGTLCYLILLEDANGNYLVLQVKQALPIYQKSMIYVNKRHSPGEEIVNCQRILQSSSDVFLGYFDTKKRSFYVRQFKDMKGSVKLDKLDWGAFKDYVSVCMSLLARAHSQSPNFPKVIGYLQSHEWMPAAFVTFANNYLKQVEIDYQTFIERGKHDK